MSRVIEQKAAHQDKWNIFPDKKAYQYAALSKRSILIIFVERDFMELERNP